jgi:hypothetical protein
MNPDPLQSLWDSQPLPADPDPEAVRRLIDRVKAEAAAFDRTLFWRDLRESAAGVLVSGIFGYIAWSAAAEGEPSRLLWLAAALPLVTVLFLLGDRLVHRVLNPVAGDTVVAEIDRALGRLRHQAWLLRHVLWWYILPIGAGACLIATLGILRTPGPLWIRLVAAGLGFGIVVAVNVWVWRQNRNAVHLQLEPAIADLESQRRLLTG